MKMQKSAGPVPARNAAVPRNVPQNAGGSLKRPERYRYAIHPLAPKPEELGRFDSLCIGMGVSAWGMAASWPLWWEYDGIAVLGCATDAALGIYCALRAFVVVPKLIRAIRRRMKRGLPMWLTPVYSIREKNTFGGYIPREVICRAAKESAK